MRKVNQTCIKISTGPQFFKARNLNKPILIKASIVGHTPLTVQFNRGGLWHLVNEQPTKAFQKMDWKARVSGYKVRELNAHDVKDMGYVESFWTMVPTGWVCAGHPPGTLKLMEFHPLQSKMVLWRKSASMHLIWLTNCSCESAKHIKQ